MLIRLLSGETYSRPLKAAPFAALDGLFFYVEGYVSGTADDDRAQPWEIGSYILDGATVPGFTLNVVLMAVWWPDAPLRAERVWVPGPGHADQIQPFPRPASPDDQRRAADAQAALIRFCERLGSQGKRKGDGATWAGGLPHFLDDLWTALEKLTTETSTPYGHDPTSKQFRSKMREWPFSEWTMRDWLRNAGLRPKDITSGRVTRANYSQFVPK